MSGSLSILNQVIAWTSILTTVAHSSFVFYRLRLRLDPAAISLILVYLLVILQSLIYDILDDHKFKVPVIVECMNPAASIMSYAIIYYLVFEMMIVKNTIGSNCHKERAKQMKRIEVTRVIVYVIFFGFYASTTFWVFVMSRKDDKYYAAHINEVRIILYLRAVAKIFIDGYLIT